VRIPVEIIGTAETPGAKPEWIVAECEPANELLKKVY
jgi:hypothetical protein